MKRLVCLITVMAIVCSFGAVQAFASSGASITLDIANSWKQGADDVVQYNITITNTGDKVIEDWTAVVEVGDKAVLNGHWNFNANLSDGILIITPLDWNKTIPVGGSVGSIGLTVINPNIGKVSVLLDSDFDYVVNSEFDYFVNPDDTVTITKYNGSSAAVIFPEKLDGRKVTAIGDGNSFFVGGDLVTTLFDDPTDVKKIVLPDGLEAINDRAFMFCTDLVSINIPSSVTTIGDYAFFECLSLPELTITSDTITIGEYAFFYCESLETLTISSDNAYIKDLAFYMCVGLSSVTFTSDTPPMFGYEVFAMVPFFAPDFTIYVPADSLLDYQSASNFTVYFNNIAGY